MDVRLSLPRRRRAVATLVAVLASVTPAIAACAIAPPANGSSLVRAIVVARPGAPLPASVAGGRVLQVFRELGSELVAVPASTLSVLAHDARVAGLAPDVRGQVAGKDYGAGGEGVLAAQALGGIAGQPRTGAGVNVALLDTGVSDTAALNRASGRITDGVDVSRLSRGGRARTKGKFTDGYGHGTFLASLIAGGRVAGSGAGAIGIAPAARIVVVKVADGKGNTSLAQVLAGLDWVAAHARAIRVVNIALAVDRPTAPAYGVDPLTAGVEHVRAQGVTVVAAVGNTPDQVGDPGLDPEAFTVGAADVAGNRPTVAAFSGSGVVDGVAKPDVVAPGVHVLGVIAPHSLIARKHPAGWQAHGLFRGSGTSEATAIASGVAAAYLSLHPGADPVQVKSALRQGAEPLDPVQVKSAPRRGAEPPVSSLAAGQGLLRMATDVTGSGSATAAGESLFDETAWDANAWAGPPGWQTQLASMWSGPAWDAMSWSADTWKAMSWSGSRWSAMSWSAMSWSAMTWSAMSWSDYRWGR